MQNHNDKKLGRGLSALLGEAKLGNREGAENTDHMEINMMSVSNLIAGIYQPRKHFDQEELFELSNSIAENGIIQPIIVRKADDSGIYEIIAGERRFKASKMAGLEEVPVIIKDVSNIQALEFAIIENVQRADLSPIEEALSYKQLMHEFEYTQDQVAKRTGCSRSHIANILRLLSLPQEVQEMVDKEQITLGHAKAIINSDDAVTAAKEIIENGLTVRDAETIFKNTKQDNKKNGTYKKRPQSQPAHHIESKLNNIFLGNKVKAEFNYQKKKGKITIFFDDLNKIEELVKNL